MSSYWESTARRTGCAIALTAWLYLVPTAAAATPASQNRTGNRLYEQGKYQDAEKAYLEAGAGMPGRPEISYNLGNTLLRQKKYDQALQSLRQAVEKGNHGLQANAWYNAGNALFEMGNFRDSAQAFIQALQANPADREAKHNLELALRKLEEHQQPSQGQQENKPQNPESPGLNQKPDQPRPQNQEKPGQQPADPQSGSGDRREGGISRERALQILDALQNQELMEQRRLLEGQVRRKATGRDW